MSELIPEGWDYCKLDKYVQLQGGFAFKSQDYKETGIPLIRISNVSEKGIKYSEMVFLPESFQKINPEFCLEKNDTLIAMSGATTGKTCVIKKEDTPSLLNQRVGRFKIIREGIIKKYISFLVQDDTFKIEVFKDAIGGAQPNISSPNVEKIKILVPHKLEQQKIASILENVDNNIDKTQEIIEKYEMMKQGLMHDLFTKGIDENRKPHTEFKDSELGEIPLEWQITTLEQITDVLDPHPSHRAPPESNDGFPFVGIGDILENGQILIDKCRKVSLENVKRQNKSVPIYDYDIGFGRVASIGKVVWLRNQSFPYALSPTLAIIKPHDVDRKFIFFILQSQYLENQIKMLITGSTRSSLGIELLRILKIPLPPKSEQKTIGETLDLLNNKIISEKEYLNKLQKIKKGLMQDLLTGKVRVKT